MNFDFRPPSPKVLHFLNFLSTLAGGVISSINSDKQNQLNKAESAAARKWQTSERVASQNWNLDMWNKNNAYNEQIYNQYQSPAAMLKQMRDARINPIGQFSDNSEQLGSNSVANGSSAPGTSVPNMSGPLDPNLMESLARISNINADTAKKNSDTAGQNLQNEISERTKNFSIDLAYCNDLIAQNQAELTDIENQFQRETFFNRVLQTAYECGLKKYEEAIAGIELIYAPDRIKAQVEKIESEGKLNDQEYALNEMTQFLAKEFGINPKANWIYNVASLLLNPNARNNIISKIGIKNPFDMISDVFK